MPRIAPADQISYEAATDVLVIGAGAAGLVTGLTAREHGADVVIVERDPAPRGSTALSAGLIPAAGTLIQQRAGIDDDVARFVSDIQAKARGRADPTVVATALGAVGEAIDRLATRYGFPFEVITDFRYPGHSAARMHALPRRTGSELIERLIAAVEDADIPILTAARAETLFVDADGRVAGVEVLRPAHVERIACRALVLACNGYGGNPDLVRQHLPGLADALWFGHSGNTGDAVIWGAALGARLKDMSGHQGHGSVATPHGILITWATMTEGGVQVNAAGERFSDEGRGYSEQGARVLAQSGGIAWSIFDGRIAAIARQFEDFRSAEAQGAVVTSDSLDGLARRAGLPPEALERTGAAVCAAIAAGATDAFGRSWRGVVPLQPPFHAVKVTGALFHTQGGLAVDADTRMLSVTGRAFPNLFAVGGAAVGASGPDAAGYLSGNGLLTAVGLGAVAGRRAAVVRST
jgi:fumarate reductase flavoprotein subunit